MRMFELTGLVKTRGVDIKCFSVIDGISKMFISIPMVKTRGISANLPRRTINFGVKTSGETEIFHTNSFVLYGNSF
jgi:hypothetical protein